MKKNIKKIMTIGSILIFLTSQVGYLNSKDPFYNFLTNTFGIPSRIFSRSSVTFVTSLAIISTIVWGSEYWLNKSEDKFAALKFMLDFIQKNPKPFAVGAAMAAISYIYKETPEESASQKPDESSSGKSSERGRVTFIVPT